MSIMPRNPGTLRLIGGAWRRRLITFDASLGVRPTSDRTRETLFNWLQADIVGANCLDAFAGSGALGFEALSRGAESVTFVDSNRKILTNIDNNAKQLSCQKYKTQCLVLPDSIAAIEDSHFSIAFIDPPFGKNLMVPTIQSLLERGVFLPDVRVYFECEAQCSLEPLFNQWTLVKHAKTRALQYGIMQPK